MAMNYATWVFNKLLQNGVGLSPEELFCVVKCPCSDLLHAHICGCLVYVLRGLCR